MVSVNVAAERVEESIPISLVAHHAFCPRRAWLEVNGEKLSVSDFAMETGSTDHRTTDDPATGARHLVRAWDVASREHGFHGRIDSTELLGNGTAHIIEYKSTPVRRRAETTEPMRRQLALQKVALEEMGQPVSGCSVYFTTHHRRVDVDLGDDTVTSALADVADTRRTIDAESAPAPLEDDPRCASCSHVSLCLPDERSEEPVERRISVPNPDSQVLHLATYGALASLRSGRVVIKHRGDLLSTIPLERVQSVVVHGNVDLSSGLLRELMWRRLPIIWCSSSGRVVGWASTAQTPNGLARVQQHVASANGHLPLARAFIQAKLRNQATLLRRHSSQTASVRRLRELSDQIRTAESLGEVFGIEGAAARTYFRGFPQMLTDDSRSITSRFPGRIGRGATDPLNVLLNYTYSLLTSDCIRALLACGLDPHAGFLHSSGRNKPALALDLMEEFRPIVADSVVLGSLNNGEIRPGGFLFVRESARLSDRTRKALIAAYERRLSTEFTHPVFGYRLTWRRAIEVQARMVLGVLDGTQSKYVGVTVR